MATLCEFLRQRWDTIYLSTPERLMNCRKADELHYYYQCHQITNQRAVTVEDFSSNQEEADTKVVLYASHALNAQQNKTVMVRNYSGDVDITVVMLSHIIDHCDRIVLDFDKGKDRKVVGLSDVDVSTKKKQHSLVFMHLLGTIIFRHPSKKEKVLVGKYC